MAIYLETRHASVALATITGPGRAAGRRCSGNRQEGEARPAALGRRERPPARSSARWPWPHGRAEPHEVPWLGHHLRPASSGGPEQPVQEPASGEDARAHTQAEPPGTYVTERDSSRGRGEYSLHGHGRHVGFHTKRCANAARSTAGWGAAGRFSDPSLNVSSLPHGVLAEGIFTRVPGLRHVLCLRRVPEGIFTRAPHLRCVPAVRTPRHHAA